MTSQGRRRQQHSAREDQIFRFILTFLTVIWPARHLKRYNFARGQKKLPAPAFGTKLNLSDFNSLLELAQDVTKLFIEQIGNNTR
jgi:hypothetical protein